MLSESTLSNTFGGIFLDISKLLCVCYTFKSFPFLYHVLYDFIIFILTANNNFECKSSIKICQYDLRSFTEKNGHIYYFDGTEVACGKCNVVAPLMFERFHMFPYVHFPMVFDVP